MTMNKHFRTIEVNEVPGLPAEVQPGQHLPAITKEFLLSGRAFFHVKNPEGRTFMFKVHARKRPQRLEGQSFFVRSLSTKGDTYRYLAVLLPDGNLKITGRSDFTTVSPEYQIAAWAIRAVFDQQPIQEGYSIEHIFKCGKCGLSLSFGHGDLNCSEELTTGLHLGCRL